MAAVLLLWSFLGTVKCVYGCGHQHQASFGGTPSSPISRPATPLVWGDVCLLLIIKWN